MLVNKKGGSFPPVLFPRTAVTSVKYYGDEYIVSAVGHHIELHLVESDAGPSRTSDTFEREVRREVKEESVALTRPMQQKLFRLFKDGEAISTLFTVSNGKEDALVAVTTDLRMTFLPVSLLFDYLEDNVFILPCRRAVDVCRVSEKLQLVEHYPSNARWCNAGFNTKTSSIKLVLPGVKTIEVDLETNTTETEAAVAQRIDIRSTVPRNDMPRGLRRPFVSTTSSTCAKCSAFYEQSSGVVVLMRCEKVHPDKLRLEENLEESVENYDLLWFENYVILATNKFLFVFDAKTRQKTAKVGIVGFVNETLAPRRLIITEYELDDVLETYIILSANDSILVFKIDPMKRKNNLIFWKHEILSIGNIYSTKLVNERLIIGGEFGGLSTINVDLLLAKPQQNKAFDKKLHVDQIVCNQHHLTYLSQNTLKFFDDDTDAEASHLISGVWRVLDVNEHTDHVLYIGTDGFVHCANLFGRLDETQAGVVDVLVSEENIALFPDLQATLIVQRPASASFLVAFSENDATTLVHYTDDGHARYKLDCSKVAGCKEFSGIACVIEDVNFVEPNWLLAVFGEHLLIVCESCDEYNNNEVALGGNDFLKDIFETLTDCETRIVGLRQLPFSNRIYVLSGGGFLLTYDFKTTTFKERPFLSLTEVASRRIPHIQTATSLLFNTYAQLMATGTRSVTGYDGLETFQSIVWDIENDRVAFSGFVEGIPKGSRFGRFDCQVTQRPVSAGNDAVSVNVLQNGVLTRFDGQPACEHVVSRSVLHGPIRKCVVEEIAKNADEKLIAFSVVAALTDNDVSILTCGWHNEKKDLTRVAQHGCTTRVDDARFYKTASLPEGDKAHATAELAIISVHSIDLLRLVFHDVFSKESKDVPLAQIQWRRRIPLHNVLSPTNGILNGHNHLLAPCQSNGLPLLLVVSIGPTAVNGKSNCQASLVCLEEGRLAEISKNIKCVLPNAMSQHELQHKFELSKDSVRIVGDGQEEDTKEYVVTNHDPTSSTIFTIAIKHSRDEDCPSEIDFKIAKKEYDANIRMCCHIDSHKRRQQIACPCHSGFIALHIAPYNEDEPFEVGRIFVQDAAQLHAKFAARHVTVAGSNLGLVYGARALHFVEIPLAKTTSCAHPTTEPHTAKCGKRAKRACQRCNCCGRKLRMRNPVDCATKNLKDKWY